MTYEHSETHFISYPERDSSHAVKDKKFGFSEILGRRWEQEDALAWYSLTQEEIASLSPEEIGERLWTSYRLLDEAVLEETEAGTTASTTVYDGKNHLITATLADAVSFAAVYDKKGNPLGVIRLNSVTHNPTNPEEEERILKAGGDVSGGRVQGVTKSLAVSRGIGDKECKYSETGQGVIISEATIDIRSLDQIAADLALDPADIGSIQIITTCDGFTDAADEKGWEHAAYLLECLQREETPGKKEEQWLAKCLTRDALSDFSHDNISVAVQTIQIGSPFFMGVYDGHGGQEASHYVAKNIGKVFKDQCKKNQLDYSKQPLAAPTGTISDKTTATKPELIAKNSGLAQPKPRAVEATPQRQEPQPNVQDIVNAQYSSLVISDQRKQFRSHFEKLSPNEKDSFLKKQDLLSLKKLRSSYWALIENSRIAKTATTHFESQLDRIDLEIETRQPFMKLIPKEGRELISVVDYQHSFIHLHVPKELKNEIELLCKNYLSEDRLINLWTINDKVIYLDKQKIEGHENRFSAALQQFLKKGEPTQEPDNDAALEEQQLRQQEQQEEQRKQQEQQEEQRKQQEQQEEQQRIQQEELEKQQLRQATDTFNKVLEPLDLKILDFQKRNKINPKPKFDLAIKAATELRKNLTDEWEAYVDQYKNNPKAYEEFKGHCEAHMIPAHEKLDKHRGWAEFLINLLAAVTVVGLLIKGVVNVTNNRSFFFAQKTASEKILDKITEDLNQLPKL